MIPLFFRKKSYPLKFLISGFEHSGTTLISEIMRQHPNIDSGFEGGLLLCDRIVKFKNLEPFASNFKNAWKISESDFEEICRARSYGEAYRKIREASDVISKKNCDLFDKTPRYLQRFSDVLARVPDVKAIIIVRDMRSIMDSTLRRSGKNVDDWMANVYPRTLKHTLSYLDGLERALVSKKNAKRVLVIRYEELILDQEAVIRNVFSHLGYEFSTDYLQFRDVKYKHVYGSDIQDSFVFKYRENLDQDTQNRIIDDFATHRQYFWGIE